MSTLTRSLQLSAAFWLAALLGACASVPQTRALQERPPEDLPLQARIMNLPFFPQEAYQCGPAALATLLVHGGVETTPEQLEPYVYIPERKGSLQVDITATARSHGRLVHTLDTQLGTLLEEVAAGHPVLVLQNLGLAWLPRWHYAVLKGYDLEADELLLNSGRQEDYRVKLATFERTWARAAHWALVALPPGRLPATAGPADVFAAAVSLQDTQQVNAALEILEQALQRWPAERSLLMGTGNLQLQHGATAAAEAHFRQVLEVDPDYAPAHNNLAILLRERGDVDGAREHARTAVRLGGPFAALYAETLLSLPPEP